MAPATRRYQKPFKSGCPSCIRGVAFADPPSADVCPATGVGAIKSTAATTAARAALPKIVCFILNSPSELPIDSPIQPMLASSGSTKSAGSPKIWM